MKTGIHPEYKKTKVTCTGCGTAFDSMSTVDEISVEICSNCHPFYTGKQKLVDTAGRVDRFRAAAERAKKLQNAKVAKSERSKPKTTKDDAKNLAELKKELSSDTQDSKSAKDA